MSRPERHTMHAGSLIAMGIPHVNCFQTLQDFKVESNEMREVKNFVYKYIKDLEKNMKSGKGISFFGSNGVGKTMLSCIVLQEAYKKRYSGRRITLSNYIDKYTSTWKDPDNDEFDEFMSAEMLVLEEMGKEIDSKIARPILESLLRYRNEHNLVTITTSNMTLQNFKDFYQNSVASLINGMNTVICIEADDWRLRE